MAYYRVRVGWKTKRGGVDAGMCVKAFGPDEAREIAVNHEMKGHPARKLAYTVIEEATHPDDIRNCINEEPRR